MALNLIRHYLVLQQSGNADLGQDGKLGCREGVRMWYDQVRVLGICSIFITCGDALHERFMQLLEARCPKSSKQHRSSCAVGPLIPLQRCNGHALRCHHMICLIQLYAALPALSFLLEGAHSLSKRACFCDMLAPNVHKVARALCSGAS